MTTLSFLIQNLRWLRWSINSVKMNILSIQKSENLLFKLEFKLIKYWKGYTAEVSSSAVDFLKPLLTTSGMVGNVVTQGVDQLHQVVWPAALQCLQRLNHLQTVSNTSTDRTIHAAKYCPRSYSQTISDIHLQHQPHLGHLRLFLGRFDATWLPPILRWYKITWVLSAKCFTLDCSQCTYQQMS